MILSAQSFAGTGIASPGKVGDRSIPLSNCQFAPCVDGFVLWLQGESLFHTFLLNLVPRDYVVNDKPAWEDDSIVDSSIKSWNESITFTGPVQRFAPLSRFLRVVDQQSMFFTNGLKTAADSEDPMKAYSRADERDKYQAVKLRKDKAAWRDVQTLFSLTSSKQKPPASLNHAARLAQDTTIAMTARPRANLVGLATDQGKALLWRHERMPVPFVILASVDLTNRLGKLITEAEACGLCLSRGLFWSAIARKTIRTEPVGRIQSIADLLLSPSLELRRPGVLRDCEGRAPGDAHNKAALELSASLDPRPAYWARLERHFYALLENLPKDWDTVSQYWKPDDQQVATKAWRGHVKAEALRALEESFRSLGTTARAVQAIARVRTDFDDYDLMLESNGDKSKRRAGGGDRG
jgi:hypothetical protein